MIDIEETDTGIYAVDVGKNELHVRAVDWERTDSSLPLSRFVHEAIAGRVSELRFPEAAVQIEATGGDRWSMLGNELGPLHLDHGDYTVKIDASLNVYVRFVGPVTVYRSPHDEELVLRFPDVRSITIGFRSRVRIPIRTIAVPPTIDGVAAAMNHLPIALETTGPERSYPSFRRHPPSIELAETIDIPDGVRDGVPETGIVFRVPDDLDSLFVAAPLAYYLQASIRPEARDRPRLDAPEVGVSYEFPRSSGFGRDVAGLLRRVFFLDCLVRNEGRYRIDLAELPLLDELPFDASRAYDASPPERLQTYLEAPFERIESRLPDWHLATYVEPTVEHVPMLPRLLDRLGAIYLPDASSLGREEFVDRSIEAFYRSAAPERGGRAVELLSPDLGEARMHGWLADGVPIDVFKAVPEAYDHRLDYLTRTDASKLVRVVLNDPDMEREQVEVADIYRDRAETLSIDVEIRHGLDREALADVLQRPADFLHYIGHCTEEGLGCADGYLSVSNIETCPIQTFFLNACGSYREGLELIRRGSVAGAVTLEEVLNRQATRVGTAFAQLIVHGFSIERALRIARRRSIINKGYMVIGDGTHTLSQGDDQHPVTTRIERRSPDRFRVVTESFSMRDAGGAYQSYIPTDENKHLFGNEVTLDISKWMLLDYLRRGSGPCIYDGRYYWSDDLYSELADDRSRSS